MSQSRSVVKSLYSAKKFPQTCEQLKANDFVCPVIENQTGWVCGFAQILETENKTPEVGIEIMDEFMGTGYESTKLLMEYYAETHENYRESTNGKQFGCDHTLVAIEHGLGFGTVHYSPMSSDVLARRSW